MRETARPKRVAERVRQEIARLLTQGLKDPRIGFASVMGVRMSPDLRYANVYVSLFGSDAERKSSLVGLRNASGWIRREVGKQLGIRVTPEIRFFPDKTLDHVYQLEKVFDEIHEVQRTAPMLKVDLDGIIGELREAGSFLVTSHESPDGDAVGSVLGMYHLLRGMGKDRVVCAMGDPVPQIYRSLPAAKGIVSCDEEPPAFDVALVLDVDTVERTGAAARWIGQDKRVVVIDHHLGEGPGGAIGFIDSSYAATGEIIAELYERSETPLTRDAAHCLYVAQVTDTNGYRYSNTNPRSHRIAATLMEAGLDTAAICRDVFDVISAAKFELLRRVMERMEVRTGGRLAWSYVTAQDLAEAEGRKEDLDGLVNYTRRIEGVQVGILFNSVEPQVTKVSMRSDNSFNSAEFLAGYGGGGHAAAAGATVNRALEPVRRAILEEVENGLAGGGARDAGGVGR